MTRYRLGCLLGDDIGPEVVPEAVRVASAALDASGVAVEWVDVPIGMAAYRDSGETMPAGTLDRLRALDAWILGPIGHRAYPKDDPKAINPHPIIRKQFDMYASWRPARGFANLPRLHDGVDLVIVRENTEGFQPDRNVVAGSGEFRPTEDVTISVRVITRKNSNRIARAAFDLARTRRRHVTAVHKDTVFKLGCGMFAEECRKVAQEYPDVTFDEVIVDTFALEAVMRPQRFDVVVTTNMFGDIMADLTAGLVGGLGMAPAISFGPVHGMAQATHGSAPDIAGQGIANPYAEIASLTMLLRWLGERRDDDGLRRASAAMRAATDAVLADGAVLTRDLGGKASTREMGEAIAARVSGAFAR